MRNDRGLKREHYQAADVNEYWIVDAKAQLIELWRPGATHPEVVTNRLVWLPAGVMSEFSIDLAELFA